MAVYVYVLQMTNTWNQLVTQSLGSEYSYEYVLLQHFPERNTLYTTDDLMTAASL